MNISKKKFCILSLVFIFSMLFNMNCYALDVNADFNQAVTNIYSTQDNPILCSFSQLNAGVTSELVDFDIGGFYIRSTDITVTYDEKDFVFDPVSIWNFNAAVTYKFDRGHVSASGAIGEGDCIGTDLYYLLKENTYFKSECNAAVSIDATLDDAYVNFFWLNVPLEIYNYDYLPFGNAQLQCAGGVFSYDFYPENFAITPYAGDFFAWGTLDFTATKKTQNYWLFPYEYYTIGGDVKSNIVFAGAAFVWGNNFNNLRVNAGTALVTYYDLNSTTEYLYKKNKLFNGSSGNSSDENTSLANYGVVIVDLQYSYKFVKTTFPVELYADKLFFVPYSLEKNIYAGSGSSSGDDSGSGGSEGNTFDIWAYLCSGFTVGIKVKL